MRELAGGAQHVVLVVRITSKNAIQSGTPVGACVRETVCVPLTRIIMVGLIFSSWCMCVGVCVCARVRVSDKQEQASSNLFVIAILLWVRVRVSAK